MFHVFIVMVAVLEVIGWLSPANKAWFWLNVLSQ